MGLDVRSKVLLISPQAIELTVCVDPCRTDASSLCWFFFADGKLQWVKERAALTAALNESSVKQSKVQNFVTEFKKGHRTRSIVQMPRSHLH